MPNDFASMKKLGPVELASIAKLFGLLSEPARLQILQSLQAGPATVTELTDRTGLKQANLSKHLSMLYDAGLLSREKDGVFVRYQIAESLVFDLCRLVCGKLHRDAALRAGALSAAVES